MSHNILESDNFARTNFFFYLLREHKHFENFRSLYFIAKVYSSCLKKPRVVYFREEATNVSDPTVLYLHCYFQTFHIMKYAIYKNQIHALKIVVKIK